MPTYVYVGCMVLALLGCRSDSQTELEEVGMGVPEGMAATIVTAGSLDTAAQPNNELHDLGTKYLQLEHFWCILKSKGLSSSHSGPNTWISTAQNSPSSFLAWQGQPEHSYCPVSSGISCYCCLGHCFIFFLISDHYLDYFSPLCDLLFYE